MILCNLAVLLAERHLKISKVSQNTKISRTTLTALTNNYGSGIQYDTINTLCLYLKINPDQLILFAPVDIGQIKAKIDQEGKNTLSVELSMYVGISGKNHLCSMPGHINLGSDNSGIHDIQIDMELWDEEANPDDEDIQDENIILEKAFGMLTRPFLEHISQKIQHTIIQEMEEERLYYEDDVVEKYPIADGYSLSLNWPFDDWGNG